jgi:hypothetical protein
MRGTGEVAAGVVFRGRSALPQKCQLECRHVRATFARQRGSPAHDDRLSPHVVFRCVADRYHLQPEKSLFPRRKVYGLILWIGSNDRYNMLRSQMESVRLQHAPSPRWADEERIFGWAATEDVYPCKYVGPYLGPDLGPYLGPPI